LILGPSRPRELGEGHRRSASPPQLFALSFIVLILFGTIGLKVLPGIYTAEPLSWLDALFTATSAVCVTGLIVVDTATYFTRWGQGFILLLIQLGGLGMITFATLIIVSLGRRLSLVQEEITAGAAMVAPNVEYRHLTRSVVIFTFIMEAAGALILWLLWFRQLGPVNALWHAVFQSISAFCNAGFSTFSDSLMGFQLAPGVLLTIMMLIVVGGIGFLTIDELYLAQRAHASARPFRISLHTRLVLAATAILLLGGWVVYLASEWNATLGDMPIWARVANAMFMSVTARTAGFNTVDYAQTEDGTDFFTILLMAIGGSPGSTAGGIKTTTFALIGLLAWSRLRGDRVVNVAGRSVPDETVQRSVGLFAAAFGTMTLAILLFTYTEGGMGFAAGRNTPFLAYMFEAVSAFNTVGLSMGVTPDLSYLGRVLTVLLMYVGRVGPLTFAAAIALRAHSARSFRYAYENVVVG
jgi:trk system potassium uptake protein TrkH